MLAATNAFTLNLTEEADLEGLPEFVREAAVETAKSKNMDGWAFDLSAPSYGAFMKYSTRRDLRQKMWMAYNTRATEGDNSNIELCRQIAELRLKIANILGYETYADYALEERMAKNPQTVNEFIQKLLEPSLPAAKAEVKELYEYARANGFEDSVIQPWDFGFWSEKLKDARYSISDEQLKPYFRLESCIDAAFGLAGRLYGLVFEERTDIPVYHPDVKVYDVKDSEGNHKALFYADFFPRPSKRGGAWMTEFRGQSIVDGVEKRPFISLVTNFTKPAAGKPSLITDHELTTLLHEFGHSLHGILAEGKFLTHRYERFPRLRGAAVADDGELGLRAGVPGHFRPSLRDRRDASGFSGQEDCGREELPCRLCAGAPASVRHSGHGMAHADFHARIAALRPVRRAMDSAT